MRLQKFGKICNHAFSLAAIFHSTADIRADFPVHLNKLCINCFHGAAAGVVDDMDDFIEPSRMMGSFIAHIFASPSIFSIASFSFSFIGDSGSKHISTNFLSSGLFASTGGFASYNLPCGLSQRAKM